MAKITFILGAQATEPINHQVDIKCMSEITFLKLDYICSLPVVVAVRPVLYAVPLVPHARTQHLPELPTLCYCCWERLQPALP